jgi:hypothetical protein
MLGDEYVKECVGKARECVGVKMQEREREQRERERRWPRTTRYWLSSGDHDTYVISGTRQHVRTLYVCFSPGVGEVGLGDFLCKTPQCTVLLMPRQIRRMRRVINVTVIHVSHVLIAGDYLRPSRQLRQLNCGSELDRSSDVCEAIQR